MLAAEALRESSISSSRTTQVSLFKCFLGLALGETARASDVCASFQ